MSFVSHLEGAIDGTQLEPRTVQTLHKDRPIWVKYDLDAVKKAVSRSDLVGRTNSMWRYRELLPVEHNENIVSLGEGMTPLVDCPKLARRFGVKRLVIKDESQMPTGSFKARGLAMAVSMAKELGIATVAIPTAGNAGGALAAYAARAAMCCYVFMPGDTPAANRAEAALFGAKVFRVNGLITDCAAIIAQGKERFKWFDMSTLKEPYRIEGKKTMGFELAEQMHWSLPDAIFYPTGGGTGLIGMWKAFAELAALDWLDDDKRPMMFSCQSSTCAPIVRAFEKGERFADPWENAQTCASGLRVPKAAGDFMILDAVQESGGAAIAAEENRLVDLAREASRLSGVSVCPESGACFGALETAVENGQVSANETVVIFNTGAAQKYVEAIDVDVPTLDCADVDWNLIERV